MEQPKRILVAPLDWGLGHATRCIPLIRELQKQNCVVFVAASGRGYELLKKEFFMALRIFEIEGYNPEYPEGNQMVWKMAKQFRSFLKIIAREQLQAEKIVERNQIDIVISDNRYGFFSTKVKSVFITHQLQIQMPAFLKWMQTWVNRKNHQYIQRFSECWVPAPEDSFLPTLTQNTVHLNIRHIGYLSRFEKKTHEKKFEYCAICSGPEPQRSYFDALLSKQLHSSGSKAIIVRGKTESMSKYFKKDGQLVISNFLTTNELNDVIEQSEIIIARPGYSTIMDLAQLGKKAIFIPTPGQTEQLYLAEQLKKKRVAYYMNQEDFDLETAVKESADYTGFTGWSYDHHLLQNAVKQLLNEKAA